MQTNEAYDLMDKLMEAGYEAELYENYSGRGMYGNTTTGVTSNVNPLSAVALGIKVRHDNMGLDYIYY